MDIYVYDRFEPLHDISESGAALILKLDRGGRVCIGFGGDTYADKIKAVNILLEEVIRLRNALIEREALTKK